jgi:hypothetical protein
VLAVMCCCAVGLLTSLASSSSSGGEKCVLVMLSYTAWIARSLRFRVMVVFERKILLERRLILACFF